MRKIMVTIAAAIMALNVAAYNPGIDPKDYCVMNRNGKTVIEHNGKVITKEIKFSDGSRIKPNGTVLLASGKTVKLAEGECVNESTISELSKRKNEKVGDQKDWEMNKNNMDEFPDVNGRDSTKTDPALDPDRYKNDQSDPQKGDKTKDSDEEPPKK